MKIDVKQEMKCLGTAAMLGVMFYAVSIIIVFFLGRLGWWINDLDKLPESAEKSVNHAVFITSFISAYGAVRIGGAS